MTPTLYATNVILKPFQMSAVRQSYVDWLNDKEVMAFSEQRHHKHDLRSARRYVTGFNGTSSHLWAIHEVARNTHIGNVSANLDKVNNLANVGILIGHKPSWGKGYGRQAWKAACDWLLDKDNPIGARKVEAGCMSTNLAMRRVFDLTGMTFEGERKLHFLVNGAAVGKVYYGRVR